MIFYRSLSVLFLCLCACSCVGTGGSDLEVIEKSRQNQPQWIFLPEKISESEGSTLVYVKQESFIQNLALGIKLTQVTALSISEKLLQQKVFDELSESARTQNLTIATDDPSIVAIVKPKVSQVHAERAVISDIYYEKIKDSRPQDTRLNEFYRVYVKVDFPKQYLQSILESVADQFQKVPNPTLSSLGRLISRRFEKTKLTH